MIHIGFISDIHFGKLARTKEFAVPGCEIKDKSESSSSFKEGMIKVFSEHKIKYLFIAGDLTSTGSPQEYYYCEKKILELAQDIGLSPDKIICCLGNHDVDWSISSLAETVNNEEMDLCTLDIIRDKYQLISANTGKICMKSLVNTNMIGWEAPFSGIWAGEDFIAFILNSGWYSSKSQKVSHGKLGKEQLMWFEGEVRKYTDDKRKKIVMLHHHPFNYMYPNPVADFSAVEEGSELLEIIGTNGIDLVLHGHRHHPRAITKMENGWKHPVSFVCAGSLAVNSEHRSDGEIKNTLHIIGINDNSPTIELYNYQYTNATGWSPMEAIDDINTPMDYRMYMGKIYTEEEMKNTIMSYRTNEFMSFEMEKMDESLRYIRMKDLQKKMIQYLGDSHEIHHTTENKILIVRKDSII